MLSLHCTEHPIQYCKTLHCTANTQGNDGVDDVDFDDDDDDDADDHDVYEKDD